MMRTQEQVLSTNLQSIVWAAARIACVALLTGSAAAEENVEKDTASILALNGDPAYGEYLSTECVTCHKLKGEPHGIPQIVGLSTDIFVRSLVEYKHKAREHQIMNMVTGQLGADEIAALAAYFGSLEPQ